jgi:heptose-I-phosphate ethanolaminephosphotransferase
LSKTDNPCSNKSNAGADVFDKHSEASLNLSERRRNCFDDALLPMLGEVLKQDKKDKIIFLHLMGNHAVYRARFPRSAEFFNANTDSQYPMPADPVRNEPQKQVVDDYDNAARFNDTIVGAIIDEVRKAGGDSFVVYFSDHGEEVYDFRNFAGHSDEVTSPFMLKIPFIVWLSEGYRADHEPFASALRSTVGRPYINKNFSASLADLARLKQPNLDPARSLFSAKYEPAPRIMAGKDYETLVRSWAPDKAHANGMALLPRAGTSALK